MRMHDARLCVVLGLLPTLVFDGVNTKDAVPFTKREEQGEEEEEDQEDQEEKEK